MLIGNATNGTPLVWKNRKQARKWVEALTVAPVWRDGAYYDYLYEGVALKPHIRPPLVPDDEFAFEGDLVEPTDPSIDQATTFEVPTEASIEDLTSQSHIPIQDALDPRGPSSTPRQRAVVDALGLTRDPPHSPNLTTLSEGALTCQESVYVGPEFYLCSKSEGHGGAHQDQPKNFRWGEPEVLLGGRGEHSMLLEAWWVPGEAQARPLEAGKLVDVRGANDGPPQSATHPEV